MEQERRKLAADRRRDSLLAGAIANFGIILATLLPLVLCGYLLHHLPAMEGGDAMCELLLQDLTANKPLLLRCPRSATAVGGSPAALLTGAAAETGG